MKFLSVVILVLCSCFAVEAQQDYTDQLISLILLSDSGKTQEAIDGYNRLIAEKNSPAWLKAGSYFEIAVLAAKEGDSNQAIAMFQKSLESGFDDCIDIQKSDVGKNLSSNPAFQESLNSIRISGADYRELLWLHAERENTEHDGKMMMTANMNRVDQHYTDIPQAIIPSRPTNSTGVLYARAQLRVMQVAVQQFVKQSDAERIRHVTTMTMIGQAPSLTAVQISATEANAAAEARKNAIQQRAFKSATNASTDLQPCK